MKPIVAILDAGAQYVDLIHKAVERQGFPAVVLPIDTPFSSLPKSIKAVVVSGGPSSSYQKSAPMPDTKIWEQTDIPTFNICYGMQAFALYTGGNVNARGYRSDSRQLTTLDTAHPLFEGIREQTQALFTHGDFVNTVGPDVDIIGSHVAKNGDQVISAIARGPHVCVQFHPEVTDDTPQGYEIFKNFFANVAKLQADENFLSYRLDDYISKKRTLIKDRVQNKHVIAFVSGGVDSVVAVMLAKEVVAEDHLHMYYIDSGFMRDEDDSVIETLQNVGLHVHKIEAAETFENATAVIEGTTIGPLKTTVDPGHKRRIIGETFIDIQDRLVQELGLRQTDIVLLQGTNAADRIESGFSKGGGHATAQIKEHHNQVKRVRDLNPLEPIDDLFKDEIRTLAVTLGLPDEIAYRQPFPGPGLAIRILCLQEDGIEPVKNVDQAKLDTAIADINTSLGCSLTARLLPVRSVGVGGDARSHIQAVAIAGSIEPLKLRKVSDQLTSEFRGLINRVIFACGESSIESLHPVATDLTSTFRAVLREADAIVMEVAREMKLMRRIEQFPVVLLPLGSNGKHSIVLRPLFTRAHLTVQALLPVVDLPQAFFDTVTSRILKEVNGISHVFTDLTNKPPATTEWE